MLALMCACLALASTPEWRRTTVPLVRPSEDYPRIFVEAILSDGKPALFLVDTGADISVLSERTAERLDLDVKRNYARLSGLSGTVAMHRGVLEDLTIGDATLHDIEVAVGVSGMSDTVGWLPLDGLLGNNIWGQFILDIDYGRNTLTLHKPGDRKIPKRGTPMFYDGHHVHAPLTVHSGPATGKPVVQVDTGAGELTLCADTGKPFEGVYTEGLESVRGIGASETLPPFRFLRMTRRIPLDAVELGGQRIKNPGMTARWVSFEAEGTKECPSGMRGLLGHQFLEGHRVVFDYPGGHLSMSKSKRRKKFATNGHAVALGREIEAYGSPPGRGLVRAKLQLGSGDDEAATKSLHAFLATEPRDEEAAEARVLLARVLRMGGNLEGSALALSKLTAGALVDEDEIVSMVNSLVFEDQAEQALKLAERAAEERPQSGWPHVARADALLAIGRADEARDALLLAARLEQYPDAHLLRRARVALATGDRHGSMAIVRRLLELYPFSGHHIWFYAMLLEGSEERETFEADVQHAMARLHPERKPIDFLVAVARVVGDDAEAKRLLHEGVEQHCSPLEDASSRDNCMAWYWSLAGVNLDEALSRSKRALAAEGERPDYLDTLAMVHLARGEAELAKEAAVKAARLSPEDVYMLWQAERIAALAASTTPRRTE